VKPASADKPLRILAVVNLPWDPRLGAARVWIELADEWTRAGHTVEKFCLTDAFPVPTSSRGLSALRQVLFARRAARHVKRHAHRFDVIDALIGTLPFSKSRLGFRGLLVARSIGLPRLYQQFDRLSRQRWPNQPRGKFLGQFFYRFTFRRLHKNSEEAIRTCDLLNVPNEDEVRALEAAPRFGKPVVVQPYGLNDHQRELFAHAALPAAVRLARKKICFIGMWGLRKGSRDWPKIIRAISAEIPEAQFLFLGIMIDEQTLIKELGNAHSTRVHCVQTYEPDELPQLLADCAVGLFPSYIEGFGLAVLEQLASGIPTIAYDVSGPRHILGPHSDLFLTPTGDVSAIAARAVAILRMPSEKYAILSNQCCTLAARFRWEKIAADTIRQYRIALEKLDRPILFTQSFPLAHAGGGPRILRSLLEDAPLPTLCVCTSSFAHAVNYQGSEIHLPLRPDFGRIERSRLASLPPLIAPLFRRRFIRRLEKICRETRVRALHSIAHGGPDFYFVYLISKKLALPFILHLHDDVIYTGAAQLRARTLSSYLGEAWRNARARFVISEELGSEYNKRYGQREFVVVTDGLESIRQQPRPPAKNGLRIYFMGLFHLGYEPNLEALIQALDLLPADLTAGRTPSITLRCDYLRPAVRQKSSAVRVLPFGAEADVQSDLETADCLYLPLHFGERDWPFAAYSLSTKMVTYLGSGIPILYHGPAGTAVSNLLARHQAAALATSLEPAHIAGVLAKLLGHDGPGLADNALHLARAQFLRTQQRSRFWNHLSRCLDETADTVRGLE
jgi:glycosyltransferase involved in cell wall biosynthesis